MACVVPKCSCTVLKKPSSKSRTMLQFVDNSCSGCGHYPQLHRNYTSRDNLIIDELSSSDSNPCTGLIPMSSLSTKSSMFDTYSLIPLASEDMSPLMYTQCDVVCTCSGFHFKDISKVLLQFNKFTYDDTTRALPLVQCDRCSHPLINHQSIANEARDDDVMSGNFRKYHVLNEAIDDASLIDIVSCDNHVTVCAIIKESGQWKLVCGSYPLPSHKEDNNGSTKSRSRKRKRANGNDHNGNQANTELIDGIKTTIKDHHMTLDSTPLYLSCASNSSCSTDSSITVCIGYHQTASVYTLTRHNQIPSLELLKTFNTETALTMLVLSCRGSRLCIGSSNGHISIATVPFTTSSLLNVPTTADSFANTQCEWDTSERHLFIGKESGEMCYYFINNGDNEDIMVSHHTTLRVCAGPVTCLKWLEHIQGVAVGSADGQVYLLSTPTNSYGPLNKYFDVKLKPEKIKLQVVSVLRGHGSFISSICTHGSSHLLTAGWDGLIMLWPLPLVPDNKGREIRPVIEDEPNKIWKIGHQPSLTLIPTAIRCVCAGIVTCTYRDNQNKNILVFYY